MHRIRVELYEYSFISELLGSVSLESKNADVSVAWLQSKLTHKKMYIHLDLSFIYIGYTLTINN